MRIVWLVLGLASVALAIAGAVLPLLPATPFALLAVFCFSRSSPALHGWLLDHPVFGKAIRDWQENRAIGRRAKISAMVVIALTFGLSIVLGVSGTVLAIQAVVLTCVVLFILTRRTAP